MAEVKPINLGMIIIGIALIIGVISLFYENPDQSLIISTANSNQTNYTNQTSTTINSSINSTNSTEYIVRIINMSFIPSTLTIKEGDRVKWINLDTRPHSITSDSGNELGSSALITDESYTHKFQFDGNFNYHCNIHPEMEGRIIVEI